MTAPMTNAASTVLARLVVAAIFGPIDRTVCRFSNLTHTP